MRTATPLSPTTDARLYLDSVAAALADLPVEDRADLLDDLAGHLAAVEQEDGDVPLTVRLGPPDRYAAELRLSAGLPAAAAVASGPVARLRAQLADDWQRASQSRWGREVGAFLPQLAPAWWVLRAYLLLFLLTLVGGGSLRGAVVLDLGLPPLGWALLAVAVVASVRLGRSTLLPRRRQVLLVAEVALAALAGTVLLDGLQRAGVQTVYVQDSAPLAADGRWPLLSTAGPVTDVLPYAADGTPLEGVLLFDQDGRPLRVGAQEWWADGCVRTPRPPLASDGVEVPFSYPQRYVLEGDQYGVSCEPVLDRPAVPLPDMDVVPAPPAPEAAPGTDQPAPAPDQPDEAPPAG